MCLIVSVVIWSLTLNDGNWMRVNMSMIWKVIASLQNNELLVCVYGVLFIIVHGGRFESSSAQSVHRKSGMCVCELAIWIGTCFSASRWKC